MLLDRKPNAREMDHRQVADMGRLHSRVSGQGRRGGGGERRVASFKFQAGTRQPEKGPDRRPQSRESILQGGPILAPLLAKAAPIALEYLITAIFQKVIDDDNTLTGDQIKAKVKEVAGGDNDALKLIETVASQLGKRL